MSVHAGRATRLLAVAILTLAVAAPAAARPSAKEKRAAAVQSRAGDRHFKARRFDDAIEAYQIAYALAQDADLLRRLGEVYRERPDPAQAIYYYEQFLENTNKNKKRQKKVRAEVEARIAELRAAKPPAPVLEPTEPDPVAAVPLAPEPAPEPIPDPVPRAAVPTAVPAAAAVPAAVPTPVPAAVPVPSPLPMDPPLEHRRSGGGGGKRLAGLVILGAGLVAVGVGGYYAKVASDKSDQLSKLFENGGVFEGRHAALYEDGESAENRAIVLLSAGGGAIVLGGVLYYLGVRDRHRETVVSVGPTSNSIAATVAGRF